MSIWRDIGAGIGALISVALGALVGLLFVTVHLTAFWPEVHAASWQVWSCRVVAAGIDLAL